MRDSSDCVAEDEIEQGHRKQPLVKFVARSWNLGVLWRGFWSWESGGDARHLE